MCGVRVGVVPSLAAGLLTGGLLAPASAGSAVRRSCSDAGARQEGD